MPVFSSWSGPGDPAGLVALRHRVGDAEVIALSGGLCANAGVALRDHVVGALDSGRDRVILDMHEVREADPEGLSGLADAVRAAGRRGGQLAAIGVRPALRPLVAPLAANGLQMHRTVRSATSADDQGRR